MTKTTNLNQDPDTFLQQLFRKHDRYYFGNELRDKLVKTFKKSFNRDWTTKDLENSLIKLHLRKIWKVNLFFLAWKLPLNFS